MLEVGERVGEKKLINAFFFLPSLNGYYQYYWNNKSIRVALNKLHQNKHMKTATCKCFGRFLFNQKTATLVITAR